MRLKVYFISTVLLLVVYSCSSERKISEFGVFEKHNDFLEKQSGFESVNGVFPSVGIENVKDSIKIYMLYSSDETVNNDFEFSRVFSLKKKGRKYEIIQEVIGQVINDTCYFKINSNVKFFALKEFNYGVYKIKRFF